MIVGIAYVLLEIPEAASLKDKRRVVRSAVERARQRFNAGVAEVDHLQEWNLAGIGITCVSNSAAHADQMLAAVIAFIEHAAFPAFIADVSTETMHV